MRFQGVRHERVHASKQFQGSTFRNTHNVREGLSGPKSGVMREFLFGRAKRKPHGSIPVANPLETWAQPVGDAGLRVTWLGHSTMLIEVDGFRLLTDPVFARRIGPANLIGPVRFHAPPVSIEQLPKLDAILVSHDHFDHLDKFTMKAIRGLDTPIVTSLGVGQYMEGWGIAAERIHELDWWESYAIPGGGLQFTATPSQHFSGRLTGRNATLWSSWVMETAKHKLFFSGDTGLTDEFAAVHDRFGKFDLVALEVGAWHPAWGTIHLGPENALKAFGLLGGGTLMPVHWGTFDLGLHPWAQPAEHLLELQRTGGQHIVMPRLGIPFVPAEMDELKPWWREVTGEPEGVADVPAPELTTDVPAL